MNTKNAGVYNRIFAQLQKEDLIGVNDVSGAWNTTTSSWRARALSQVGGFWNTPAFGTPCPYITLKSRVA